MELDSQIFKRSLIHAVADWPFMLSEKVLEKLWIHFGAVVECNRQFNLTRITDPRQAAVKHYADSLALYAWASFVGLEFSAMLDIGTGAGFPAIPIAVLQPTIKVVALESTAKKASFVARIAKDMALNNIMVEHAHSSHWKSADKFQVVTSRAVASTAVCIKNFGAYVQSGGYCVLFKTADLNAQEIVEGQDAARGAKLTACKPFFYELPQTENTPRNLNNSAESQALNCADSQEVVASESNIESARLRRQLVVFQR